MRYVIAAIIVAAIATAAVADFVTCNQNCHTFGNTTTCTIYCTDGSMQTCTTNCYGNSCTTNCY